MGYFNYFIKCIIRNITYHLCKPKVLLTVLLAVAILFVLHSTGYCVEWDQSEIDTVLSRLGGLVTDLKTNNSILYGIESLTEQNKQQLVSIDTELNNISSILANIKTDTTNITSTLSSVLTQIGTINTTLTQLAVQQNIFFEDMSSEIRMIRESLLGTEGKEVSVEQLGLVNNINAGSVHSSLLKVYIPMEYKYTYTIKVTYRNPSASNIQLQYMLDSKNLVDGNSTSSRFSSLGSVESGTVSKEFTITTRDYKKPYLYLFYGFYVTDVTVEASIEGIVDVIDRTNQNINDSLNENNQLQQESNQLQQEQNDLIKDDNVNTDGFEFATNDTNNPTEDGFNTLFTSIYNAFCNTSSAPLTLTLPYVNETFTIQPNLVSNAMQKMRFRSCGNVNSVFLLLWCLSVYI